MPPTGQRPALPRRAEAQPQEGVRFYRRRLPHYEIEGATYFVTFHAREGIALTEAERDMVVETWRHWDGIRYTLWAVVVMPNHVHALLMPLSTSLEQILHTNKGWTAHEINKARRRTSPVWQRERYDRIVRSEADWSEKWQYIAQNPVKAGLSDSPEAYRWYFARIDVPPSGTTAGPAVRAGDRPAAGATGYSEAEESANPGSAAGPAVPPTGQRPALPSEPPPRGSVG